MRLHRIVLRTLVLILLLLARFAPQQPPPRSERGAAPAGAAQTSLSDAREARPEVPRRG